MENKRLFQYFVCTIVALSLPIFATGHLSKVVNLFQEPLAVGQGDFMQCKITDTNAEIPNNQFNVYTVEGTTVTTYHYMPVSGKCFSFKVRAQQDAHIALSSTPYVTNDNKLEVILEYVNGKLCTIRETKPYEVFLAIYNKSGMTNDREYRGFWIRWLDDELLEVGREGESEPFMYHRFSNKLEINYIGIMTWYVKAAWIIDLEPNCPGTQAAKNTKVISDCLLFK